MDAQDLRYKHEVYSLVPQIPELHRDTYKQKLNNYFKKVKKYDKKIAFLKNEINNLKYSLKTFSHNASLKAVLQEKINETELRLNKLTDNLFEHLKISRYLLDLGNEYVKTQRYIENIKDNTDEAKLDKYSRCSSSYPEINDLFKILQEDIKQKQNPSIKTNLSKIDAYVRDEYKVTSSESHYIFDDLRDTWKKEIKEVLFEKYNNQEVLNKIDKDIKEIDIFIKKHPYLSDKLQSNLEEKKAEKTKYHTKLNQIKSKIDILETLPSECKKITLAQKNQSGSLVLLELRKEIKNANLIPIFDKIILSKRETEKNPDLKPVLNTITGKDIKIITQLVIGKKISNQEIPYTIKNGSIYVDLKISEYPNVTDVRIIVYPDGAVSTYKPYKNNEVWKICQPKELYLYILNLHL